MAGSLVSRASIILFCMLRYLNTSPADPRARESLLEPCLWLQLRDFFPRCEAFLLAIASGLGFTHRPP